VPAASVTITVSSSSGIPSSTGVTLTVALVAPEGIVTVAPMLA